LLKNTLVSSDGNLKENIKASILSTFWKSVTVSQVSFKFKLEFNMSADDLSLHIAPSGILEWNISGDCTTPKMNDRMCKNTSEMPKRKTCR